MWPTWTRLPVEGGDGAAGDCVPLEVEASDTGEGEATVADPGSGCGCQALPARPGLVRLLGRRPRTTHDG